MRLRLALCFAAALAGCSVNPDYAPPPQKVLPDGPNPPRIRDLIRMGDPDADAFIADEVFPGPAMGRFKWTKQNPSFRVWTDGSTDREFFARFAVVASHFAQTGPVTIRIQVRGREIAAPVFDKPGDYEYSHAVPTELLAGPQPIPVAMRIWPVVTAKADGQKMGVYLDSVGLPKISRR